MSPKQHTGLRIDQAALDRLDALAKRMSVRAGGLDVSRSDAARMVMERGLDTVEADFDRTAHIIEAVDELERSKVRAATKSAKRVEEGKRLADEAIAKKGAAPARKPAKK